jgi:cobalt-zinc-cadmium efflux system outer membrane protein
MSLISARFQEPSLIPRDVGRTVAGGLFQPFMTNVDLWTRIRSVSLLLLALLSSCARSHPSESLGLPPGLAEGERPQSIPPREGDAPAKTLLDKLTIAEAVEEALDRNLNLLAQRLNLSLADALLVGARVRPNPVLTLDVDHFNVASLKKDSLQEMAARIDMPIVLGGKRDLRIDLAENDRKIAQAQLEDALRKIRQDVSSACVDLIQAKANLALARDNLQTFEDLVRINDKRAQLGAIAAVELKRSRVSMLQFQSGVKRAELEVSGAKTKLRTLLGRGTVRGDLDVVDELRVTPSDATVDLGHLHLEALARRPDVRALLLGQRRAEADFRLQVANGVVDLSWGAEYRWNADDPSQRLVGLFLSVPLPIFNQNAGEIARAEVQRIVSARTLEALKADVSGDVRAASDEVTSARELVHTIEGDLLQLAQEVRDGENRRYQSGATSFLEFLDAQRAFNDARQSLNDARATYRRAVIHLNSAVGSEVIR